MDGHRDQAELADGGRRFAVDASTGAVVDEVRFADYPVVAKLARWGIDGHMGVLFGWVNQLVLVAFGIGLITLIVLGYRMWWRRRPWIAANVEGYPVHVDHWPAVTRGSA